MATLPLPALERAFEQRLVHGPEHGVLAFDALFGKETIPKRKGLEPALIRATPDHEIGGLLNLQAHGFIRIPISAQEPHDIEVELHAPHRLLQPFEDEHELVQKGHLIEIFALDLFSRVVRRDLQGIWDHDPEEGAQEIEDLLEEPDIRLLCIHAREIHARIESPRAQDLASNGCLLQKIIEPRGRTHGGWRLGLGSRWTNHTPGV